ncbi:MAG: hypothetical protein NVS9B15_17360 [Acidobacteriaceae bacterium]
MSGKLAVAVSCAVLLFVSVAPGQEKRLSTGSLKDGNCDVHFRVTNSDKTPVQGAWVGVQIKRSAGSHDNMALHTNQDGRVQFLGLPDAGTLQFTVREGRRLKQVSYAASEVCGSMAAVVLPADSKM